MKQILVLLFLLNIHSLYAQEQLTLTDSYQNIQEFTLDYYEDQSKKLKFDDIVNIQEFTPISNHISKGYNHANLWFRVQIKNETQTTLKEILYWSENLVHYLDLYSVSSDKSVEKQKQGVGYYEEGSLNQLHNPHFNIVLKPYETKTLYIKMYSHYPTVGAFYLFNEEGLSNYHYSYDNSYSLYFGGIIAILLYNFFIYLFSRNIAYLYYIFLVGSYLLWQLVLNNFPPFSTLESIESYYRAGSSINFMIVFLIFFTRTMLSTKEYFPSFDKMIVYLGYFALFLAVSSLFLLYHITIYVNLLATFTFPFLLYIAFKSYLHNNKIAIFFIVAQISFLTTSTIFSLMLEGVLPYNLFTRHSINVGSYIELIVFSLTLGYNIKLLQEEKIAIVATLNQELEAKVTQRTQELESSQKVLEELLIRDSMTNLYNRKHLFEISEIFITNKTPFCLIMLDIDKFKSINDTYGHSAGDRVIVLFAKLLIDSIRIDDLAFRVGGEEFIVIFPNVTKDQAFQMALTIKERIAKTKVELDEYLRLFFTTSGGVVEYLVEDRDINHTIKRADEALYKAKDSGRNKIVLG